MSSNETISTTPYRAMLGTMVAIGLVVGLTIPSFYEWTGANQSRPTASLRMTPLFVLGSALAFCLSLPWIRIPPLATGWRWPQFSIRSLLACTAIAAVSLAIGTRFPDAIAYLFFALSFAAAAWQVIVHPELRYPMAVLLGCMHLPFIWLLGWGNADDTLFTLFWFLTGLPGFLPMMLVVQLVDISAHDSNWLAVVFTGAEILAALWLFRVGRKRSLAYLAILLASTAIASLGLHCMLLA